jgi:cathepsin B
MLRSTLVVLALVVAFTYALRHEDLPEEHRKLTGQALVDHINKVGKWEATTYDRFEGLNKEGLKSYLGALKKPSHMRRRGIQGKSGKLDKVPDTFDAVENWPQCASITGLIQDQSACGSCWAVSTSSAISDRLCIASDGQIQKSLSALDLMACCNYCGYQCQGGWPDEALYFFSRNGIVTGSNYTSDAGCKPYPIAPCTQDKKTKKTKCPDEPTDDYQCKKSCNKGYTEEAYAKDHYFAGGDVLYFSNDNDAAIEELVKNGPIVAAFDVYEDFYNYKKGIYEHVGGDFLGGHAVRIVGYGVENGVKYWKVANSWDWYWGEAGYFRIKRDTDDCGFEDEIVAIAADVERSLKDK